jgi:hypothetical protein
MTIINGTRLGPHEILAAIPVGRQTGFGPAKIYEGKPVITAEKITMKSAHGGVKCVAQ